MAHVPPVSNGKFSFAVNDFFVESSGYHVHRRATVSELQALFQPTAPGSQKTADPNGHWYEAQLLHYGLPPSKTKSVAKTRLLDAVNSGNLAVPKDITKIEADLRKEWKKNEKEARVERKKREEDSGMKSAAKRKRNANEDEGSLVPSAKVKREDTTTKSKTSEAKSTKASDTKSTKKREPKSTKTSAAKSTKKPGPKSTKTSDSKADGVAKGSSRKPQTANRGAASVGPKKTTTDTAVAKPRTKQTARRSGGFTAIGTRQPTEENTEVKKPRTKQTARRSGGFTTVGSRQPIDEETTAKKPRIKLTAEDSQNNTQDNINYAEPYKHKDEADDHYNGYSDYYMGNSSNGYESDNVYHSEHGYDSNDQYESSNDLADLGPLGLINGEYDIECQDLEQWSEFSPEDFSLILCLSGNSVWGEYDFGMFHGILHMPERPFGSSYEKVAFTWRGRERSEGEMSFRPYNTGWIRFLGNGTIQGEINCYGDAKFSGQRISGNETRAPRDARSMREEWNGYNEEEYERENRARWH